MTKFLYSGTILPPYVAGSKCYFDCSYTCCKTCVRGSYASFDPSLDIVSVRDIFKKHTPNDPSDENFF